jgi:hypothetical protein
MAKGRAKPRAKSKTGRAKPKAKRRSFFSLAVRVGLGLILLLGAALAGYQTWGPFELWPRPAPVPPDAQTLLHQTISQLKRLPRLPSLRIEKTEPIERAGLVFYSADFSFETETEIILAEQALEDFWKSQIPALEVDAAYPEEAAKGATLLMANRGGSPLLAVRLFLREVPAEPVRPAEPLLPENHGRLAIVIDDLGNNREAAQQLADLPAAITLAVIPFTPYAEEAERLALRAGKEVVLHMPMEPQDYPHTDPGPGALLSAMSDADLERALLSALQEVPHAVCVNNHMGSALTEDPAAMAAVMQTLKARGLCFLDSRTSAHSLAQDQAEQAGVPAARRDVFLDNDRRPYAIRRRLLELSRLAHRHGRAVGIGHPYPETIQVLAETLPHLQKLGYEVVPLSQLANGP